MFMILFYPDSRGRFDSIDSMALTCVAAIFSFGLRLEQLLQCAGAECVSSGCLRAG